MNTIYNATHWVESFNVADDQSIINERAEPVVFIRKAVIGGREAFIYADALDYSTGMYGVFHTYEPLPEWGTQ